MLYAPKCLFINLMLERNLLNIELINPSWGSIGGWDGDHSTDTSHILLYWFAPGQLLLASQSVICPKLA